uniref:Retrotransposon Copia-like N-terminal domain-containing protein n=1 Tax=Chenopodium quinoa TaxID=63459 RepID=A0A803LNC2_CHEQI
MSKISLSDMQNPLYLHPGDGQHSVAVEKLTGESNYKEWRRSMEINLASKRKLRFVTRVIKKDTTDDLKAGQWGTCNSMAIAWLTSNMTDTVKKSVMFLDIASKIWKQLETRFLQTNGARKYRLNKEVYEIKQNGDSISEYYTRIRSLWAEIESLNMLPPISNTTPEINAFVNALNMQKEEQLLFQFLNGLDGGYTAQRSQILMQSPLPSVETACAALQQEES